MLSERLNVDTFCDLSGGQQQAPTSKGIESTVLIIIDSVHSRHQFSCKPPSNWAAAQRFLQITLLMSFIQTNSSNTAATILDVQLAPTVVS